MEYFINVMVMLNQFQHLLFDKEILKQVQDDRRNDL